MLGPVCGRWKLCRTSKPYGRAHIICIPTPTMNCCIASSHPPGAAPCPCLSRLYLVVPPDARPAAPDLMDAAAFRLEGPLRRSDYLITWGWMPQIRMHKYVPTLEAVLALRNYLLPGWAGPPSLCFFTLLGPADHWREGSGQGACREVLAGWISAPVMRCPWLHASCAPPLPPPRARVIADVKSQAVRTKLSLGSVQVPWDPFFLFLPSLPRPWEKAQLLLPRNRSFGSVCGPGRRTVVPGARAHRRAQRGNPVSSPS